MGSGTSFVKTKRMQGFIPLLMSAACEWFLIFLLLLDALLSYVVTMFASYCNLQLPCLLCSRLDHILGYEKPEFYQNLFCSHHKSEISSLILCHVHGKLADGHKMCDDCLLSVTANTKCKVKTHRLLVGKFGLVLGGSGFHATSLSKDLFTGSKTSRPCTCCGRLWKSEKNSPRSIQLKSSGKAVLKSGIPLPCAPRQSRLNQRDNLRKAMDNFSGSEGKCSFHPLSHVGYTELRFNSDSESEVPFSDDDDVSSVFQENIEASNDPISQTASVSSPKCTLGDLNPAKPNNSSTKPMPMEPDVGKHQDVNANSPEETNLQKANQKSLSPDLPELISLDEASPSPIVMNVSNGEPESKEGTIANLSREGSLPAPLSELMSLNGTQAHVGASSEKSAGAEQASDTGIESKKNGEVLEKIGTGEKASAETDQMACDSAHVSPIQENSSNMGKSSVTTKEREVPGVVIEQPTTEEVDKVKEEPKQSPALNSSVHGSSLAPAVPTNPETQGETSSSNGIQILQKSASVESGLESLDGSNIPEIEGESTADRMRRQVEHCKKCMDALQKELEEERNASAIATNEAMSMITRLQEEKAALQMEALQYLRMMEEQAEYDNKELQKVNDLLTEKEKEIQDLEAELEFYRSNLPEEPIVQGESWDSKEENITVQNIVVDNNTNTVSNISNSKPVEVSGVRDEDETDGTSFLELEDEKLYITECLKSLEKKLHQISYDGTSSHTPRVRPEKLEESELNEQETSNCEGPQLDGHEETDLSIQKNIDMSNGNHDDKDGSAASDSDDCSLSIENNHSTSFEPQASTPRREVELVVLENEISDLNDRLEALEFDHDLLDHIINSLQNGNDGKQFIQDIAHRLHELRKIGITSRG
ncbi:hypothetical protein VNO77_16416 [Canavalia gladiata]|uniref:GTD-binding domain-containing protein n=1 Tax=Canavalia gladiata TaxID=3824 RepID=A0AAN9M0D0_CANGL